MSEEKDKHDFKSGASSSGHLPPYECLTPNFFKRAALRMKLGLHYGKHNWKGGVTDKGFMLDRLNHAFEHLVKAMEEIDRDIMYTDDDLAAVVVNCMFAMEYQDSTLSGRRHEVMDKIRERMEGDWSGPDSTHFPEPGEIRRK